MTNRRVYLMIGIDPPAGTPELRFIPATKRSVWLMIGLVGLVTLPAQSAYSQGPLRRLGERIRERAVEPRRLIRPLQPLSPDLPSGSPAEPPRVRAARPPMPATIPDPGSTAAGRDAAAAGRQNALGGPLPGSRSANFNRAAAAPPRGDASRVEQSAGWERLWDDGTQPAGAATQPREPSDSDATAAPRPRGARLGVVVDTPPEISPPGLPPRRPRGAMVTEVLPGSPAAVAGLWPGDLIVAVQGRVITSVRDLVDEIARHAEGEELRLQYSRDNSLGAVALRLAGPDGLAIAPAEGPGESAEPVATDGSLLGGLGSMFGGLLGGRKPAPPQRQTPPDRSFETLPAPLPEPLPEPLLQPR